jgi:hypothetical protein
MCEKSESYSPALFRTYPEANSCGKGGEKESATRFVESVRTCNPYVILWTESKFRSMPLFAGVAFGWVSEGKLDIQSKGTNLD